MTRLGNSISNVGILQNYLTHQNRILQITSNIILAIKFNRENNSFNLCLYMLFYASFTVPGYSFVYDVIIDKTFVYKVHMKRFNFFFLFFFFFFFVSIDEIWIINPLPVVNDMLPFKFHLLSTKVTIKGAWFDRNWRYLMYNSRSV